MPHVENNAPNVGSLIKIRRKIPKNSDIDYGVCFTQ